MEHIPARFCSLTTKEPPCRSALSRLSGMVADRLAVTCTTPNALAMRQNEANRPREAPEGAGCLSVMEPSSFSEFLPPQVSTCTCYTHQSETDIEDHEITSAKMRLQRNVRLLFPYINWCDDLTKGAVTASEPSTVTTPPAF